MFVYQNGKLYVQEDSKLTGVNVRPSGVFKVEKETTTLADQHLLLSFQEVQLKFNIVGGDSYTFPVEKPTKTQVKVVEDVEPINHVKSTTRKSTRK